ncbi:Rpn family recombination-promoting nuclease/putative transposase [Carnimonas bestiolae]|uniref:Rpn family recombination-promoting nuclease/putative transposase n=1 Tax=Carnimonas bestiolae TaxID=3402172 RepID=UPI003EDBE571
MRISYDSVYKLLFSEPTVVAHLIGGFLSPAVDAALNFSAEECVSASFVSDALQQRHSDVIWRLCHSDGALSLYLVIEFQSTIDAHMALRMTTYTALLSQQLVKQRKAAGSSGLAPIIALVIYTGRAPWTGAIDTRQLFDVTTPQLAEFCPSQRYVLLDQQAVVAHLDGCSNSLSGNLVALIFRLAQYSDREVLLHWLGKLIEHPSLQAEDSLRRSFAQWLKRALLPNWLKHYDDDIWRPLVELSEVYNMLAAEKKLWQVWQEQDHQAGRIESQLRIARNLLLQTNFSDERIAFITELSVKQINALRFE